MKSFGFFNLKVYIGHPFVLEVHAGETDVQAESPTDAFAVTAAVRSEILEEILTKLATALQNSGETIELNVSGKEILRDPSFPHDRALASRTELEKEKPAAPKAKASKAGGKGDVGGKGGGGN